MKDAETTEKEVVYERGKGKLIHRATGKNRRLKFVSIAVRGNAKTPLIWHPLPPSGVFRFRT